MNTRLGMTGWESDPLGIVQKIKIDHTAKCYMHIPDYVLENSLVFWGTNRSPNPCLKTRFSVNVKKSTYQLMDFTLPKTIEWK